jgi:hypothetical protein
MIGLNCCLFIFEYLVRPYLSQRSAVCCKINQPKRKIRQINSCNSPLHPYLTELPRLRVEQILNNGQHGRGMGFVSKLRVNVAQIRKAVLKRRVEIFSSDPLLFQGFWGHSSSADEGR